LSAKKKSWKELPIGAVILEPGSSVNNKTGSWRSIKPVYDRLKCSKCALCWTYCAEGAISIRDDGFMEINLDYCKGCGVCARECPTKAIVMIEEKV